MGTVVFVWNVLVWLSAVLGPAQVVPGPGKQSFWPLRATPKPFSILPPSSAFIVMACFSFIIFSISALLCAGAGVAASDPTAATKAPATSADSVRLDISIPPIGVDLATCAVAVWRAVRRAFPMIRPDDRKGYAPRVRYMTAIGLIFLKYQWIRKHPGGPSAEGEPPSLRSRPVTFSDGRANNQDRHRGRSRWRR